MYQKKTTHTILIQNMYMMRQILHINNLSKSKRKCQLLCSLKFKEYIFNKKKKKKEKEKRKKKIFLLI